MARAKTNKRQQRALSDLLGKGVLAILLGLAFLMAPLFLGKSPILKPLAMGLRTPGWLALGIGLVLLCLHCVLKSRTDETLRTPRAGPKRRDPTDLQDAFGKVAAPAPGDFAATPQRAPTTEPAARHKPVTTWSAAVFAAIEWRRFEAVCEALFAQAGFETRSQSH